MASATTVKKRTRTAPRNLKDRQKTHSKGLKAVKKRARSQKPGVVGQIKPRLYDPAGVPVTNQIIQGDSLELLQNGPAGWVDLVFADPPFNIGYLYDGYEDLKPAEQYVKWCGEWMKAVQHALKDTGSFFLAIGDDYAAELCVEAKKLGFTMRNWIIWHYTFGQQPKHKFARSHTHILYFTKDAKKFTFNGDDIRVKSARQTIYNDPRASKKGKLPDDTWYLRPQEAQGDLFEPDQDVWNESRVCGTFKEREGWHGCQMPIAVLDRIIKAASHPGDVVLDPFNGSGTTCLSAALLGRQYVGIELNEDYVELARKRVEHALEGVEDLKAANGPGATSGTFELAKILEHVTDPNRASKVQTATDALGRPRVARRKRSA
ncbi:MAG: site-specific DNA-methyltransferase [Planctomycetota bacterium]